MLHILLVPEGVKAFFCQSDYGEPSLCIIFGCSRCCFRVSPLITSVKSHCQCKLSAIHYSKGYLFLRLFIVLGFLESDLADCDHLRELVLHNNNVIPGAYNLRAMYVRGDICWKNIAPNRVWRCTVVAFVPKHLMKSTIYYYMSSYARDNRGDERQWNNCWCSLAGHGTQWHQRGTDFRYSRPLLVGHGCASCVTDSGSMYFCQYHWWRIKWYSSNVGKWLYSFTLQSVLCVCLTVWLFLQHMCLYRLRGTWTEAYFTMENKCVTMTKQEVGLQKQYLSNMESSLYPC